MRSLEHAVLACGCIHDVRRWACVVPSVRRNGQLVLIDLDATTPMGEPLQGKCSEAYCAPEMARRRFTRKPPPPVPVAAASYDVWSFGVVLYELLAGQTLFSQARRLRSSYSRFGHAAVGGFDLKSC